MRSVWILQQTANFSLYNTKTGFYNRGVECLLCGTYWVFIRNMRFILIRLKLYCVRLNSLTVRYLAHRTGSFFAGLPGFCKISATCITAYTLHAALSIYGFTSDLHPSRIRVNCILEIVSKVTRHAGRKGAGHCEAPTICMITSICDVQYSCLHVI